MSTLLVSVLLVVGAAFALLAAVGVVRLPDLYLRLHAATKSATLGVAALALGAAVYFGDLGSTITAGLVIAFFFLTAPVAGHVIGRAAYYAGVALWEGTHHDELDRHGRGAPGAPLDTC